jgi:DNA-3-methyladenine glycosylase
VLIRALEPFEGESLMRRRRARGTARPARDFTTAELCRGPGNLTRALGITLRHNLSDLTASALRIEDRRLPRREVTWTRRIGINVGVESEWRCVAVGSEALSGPPMERVRPERGAKPREQQQELTTAAGPARST